MQRPTTTNYSERQVDIEWMQSVVKPKTAPTQLGLSFTSGTKIVTGMQKMAQRFTSIFFTMAGDVNFDQDHGTDFLVDVMRGAAQNIGQVAVAVNQAIVDVLEQMQSDDLDTTYGDQPDDERIVNASLLDYRIDRATGTLFVRIELTNALGAAYTYVLPVQASRT